MRGMPCPTCNVHSETSSKQAMRNMQRAACNMRCDACIVKCATPPPQHATRIRKRETCIAKIATCVHASYKMQRLARNMQRVARNEMADDGAGAASRALLPGAVEVARRRARQQRQHLLHTTEGVARAEDLSRHERSRRRCGVGRGADVAWRRSRRRRWERAVRCVYCTRRSYSGPCARACECIAPIYDRRESQAASIIAHS